MTTLSVAEEHKKSFDIFYGATIKYISKNDKVYSKNFKAFKKETEQVLLQLAADKLTSLFGDEFMNPILIDFEFFTYVPDGNSGGTEFMFEEEDLELNFFINFNKNLRAVYKRDLRLFCLILSDIYTHELIHGIQYIKQYQSVGVNEGLLKESTFKNREHLFTNDIRYNTIKQYRDDLPYFSNHEELVCYAKDSARQLLTAYKDKKVVFSKLSNASELKELSEASDCFYYYYDCFYINIPGLPQYQTLWKTFIKHVCKNLNEDFAI